MPTTPKLQPHASAELFPAMDEETFKELVEDIKANGLRHPIVTFEGCILDGVNRYQACAVAGVEPTTTPYLGDDALGYVVSANLRRRHLNDDQRAMIAARLATMRQGARTDLSPNRGRSQAAAAKELNVAKRRVERAASLRKHASPELVKAVEAGKITVGKAAKQTRAKSTKPTEAEIKQATERLRAAVLLDPLTKHERALLDQPVANEPLPKTKAAKPNGTEPAERPPSDTDFRSFADRVERHAAFLFGANDGPDWEKMIRHKARMPAEYRERLVDRLRSLVAQANERRAELDGPVDDGIIPAAELERVLRPIIQELKRLPAIRNMTEFKEEAGRLGLRLEKILDDWIK
jgi:ParB-like chromosome segregation protein Spo0J